MSWSDRQDPNDRTSKGWKGSRGQAATESAGRQLSDSGQSMIDGARSDAASRVGPVSYKRGGKVRKTGPANLHAGERVIPKSKVRKVERMMKRSKMKMRSSGRG